jgi:hypothetical protein
VDLIRTDLVAVALVVGVLSLAAATALATRREPAVRGRHVRGLALVVPRVGVLLTLLLALRGSTAGAVALGVATLVHSLVTRLRRSSARR